MENFNEWTEGVAAKEGLLEKLREGEVIVVFEKKDGTERTMKCTLKMDVIPEAHHPKGTGVEGPASVVKVYDVEKEGWRSFGVDQIRSIDGEPTPQIVETEA